MLDQNENVAAWVQSKRLGLGLTQKAFATLLGMSDAGERTVRGWELGEHHPSKATLVQISELPDIAPFGRQLKDVGTESFTFIDLFAGIGGIRMPFQELGGRCVFTSEWDKFAKRTYAANYGEVPEGDITKIPASEIPQHDLLLAGFPCQAFSQAGLKKGFYDTRGTLFFEIQRILAYHRPKAFLLENVKQLRGHDKGKTLATIMEILTGSGQPEVPQDIQISAEAKEFLGTRLNYQVGFRVLKASNFGVPQNRERIYLIGFDRDQVPATDELDIPGNILDDLEKVKSPTRVGDILESNENVDPKYTISNRLLAGHERRLSAHKAKGNGFGYSVFSSDSPYTNTISARYYKDGSEILIDQSDLGQNPRKLTPRECARLQGFPETFNISSVSDVQAYKQFGNSVSVPVIRAIAQRMRPFLV